MAWFTRVSRFGDVHAVFGQEHYYTCGVACVIMAAFKVHGIRPNTRAFFSEEQILAKARALGMRDDDATRGFKANEIVQLLNDDDLRMPGWRYTIFDADLIPRKIAEKVGVTHRIGPILSVNPVIVDIRWFSDRKQGHALLVDSVRSVFGKTYATVCDPSDAHVHVIELEEAIPAGGGEDYLTRYTGGKPAIGVNLWGKRPLRPAFEPQGRPATFSGTLIWRDLD